MSDEPLAFHIYDADTCQWLVSGVRSRGYHWSTSYYEAQDFDTLEAANQRCAHIETSTGKTLYVMAVMPTRSP